MLLYDRQVFLIIGVNLAKTSPITNPQESNQIFIIYQVLPIAPYSPLNKWRLSTIKVQLRVQMFTI